MAGRPALARLGVAFCVAGALCLVAAPAIARTTGGPGPAAGATSGATSGPTGSPPATTAPSSSPGGVLKIRLSQATELIDGQFVIVSWTNFPADNLVYVRQCSASPASVHDCTTTLTNGFTDATGAGNVPFQVHTGDLSGGFTCDYRHACTIAAFANSNSLSKAAVAKIAFAFPPSACPSTAGTIVTASGTTSLSRAMFGWEATVCRKPFLNSVEYTVKNSVDGLLDFVNKAVDFTGSAVPLTTSERATLASQGRSYAYAPLTVSGLTFAFNLHDRVSGKQITTLRLTPDLLAKMFTGQILNWQTQEIEDLNPGVNFPPLIEAVGRADNSASTFELTSYFDTVARQAYEAGGSVYQGGPTYIYPATSSVNLITGGDPEALEVAEPAVDNDPRQYGIIGWMDSSTAALYGLPTVTIQNEAGQWVQATPAGLQAALQDAAVNPDGVTRTPDYATQDPRAYPLPTVGYAVVPTNHLRAGLNAPLQAFLNYAATAGQSNLPQGYAALPSDLVSATDLAIAEMPKVPSPTPPTSPSPSPPVSPSPTVPTTSPSTTPPFTTASFSPLPVPPPFTTGTGTFPTPSVAVSASTSPTTSSLPPGTSGPQPSPSPGLVAVAIDATPPSRTRTALSLVVVLGLLSLLIGPALLMLARRPERVTSAGLGDATDKPRGTGLRRAFAKSSFRRKRTP